jgi:hypothetical protein
MISRPILLAALVALAAPAVAQQPAAPATESDWKAANKAMGQALDAKDVKGANGWAAAAVNRYRVAGAPDKAVLFNLALNLADTALGTGDANMMRSAAATLASVDADLLKANRQSDRIYLLRAIGQLKGATGDRAGWKQALAQKVEATRAAYGPEHRQVGVALIEYAAATQAVDGLPAARQILTQAEAIAGKLPVDDPVRAVVDLSVAKYEMDSKHPAEAARRYETIAMKLDATKPELLPLWWTASGRLANLQSEMGQVAKADATVAMMIAKIPNNNEAQPVIIVSPDRTKAAGVDPKAPPSADVTFDVGPDGKPVNIKASSQNPSYAALAEAAVRNSRYIPIIKDGKPQPTTGQSVSYRNSAGS